MTDKKSTVPPHPGTVIRDVFMPKFRYTSSLLARCLGVSVPTVTYITRGDQSVTVRMAFLLARELGTTPEYWLQLQMDHDVAVHRNLLAEEAAQCAS